jgi:hypothetical protein
MHPSATTDHHNSWRSSEYTAPAKQSFHKDSCNNRKEMQFLQKENSNNYLVSMTIDTLPWQQIDPPCTLVVYLRDFALTHSSELSSIR